MFTKKSDTGYRTARPGVHYRSLAYGDRTHLTEFHLDKRAVIPAHDLRTNRRGILFPAG